jgi:hypothetical protein
MSREPEAAQVAIPDTDAMISPSTAAGIWAERRTSSRFCRARS